MRAHPDDPWPDVDFVVAERLKEQYWRSWKRTHGTAAGIRIADELRKQVLAQRPASANAQERRRDHRAHARILAALARVPARDDRSAG